jgi:hypothetical protein
MQYGSRGQQLCVHLKIIPILFSKSKSLKKLKKIKILDFRCRVNYISTLLGGYAA